MISAFQSSPLINEKGFKDLFNPKRLTPKGKYLYGYLNFHYQDYSSEDFKYFIPPGTVKYILTVGSSGPDAYVDMRIDGEYGTLPVYSYDYTSDAAYYQGMLGYTIDDARASDKVCESVNNKITLINHTAIQYVAGQEQYIQLPTEHWLYAHWMGKDKQVYHNLEFVVDKYRYEDWYNNEATWDDVGDHFTNNNSITEYITLTPQSLDFGTVDSGVTSEEKSITIYNNSSVTVYLKITTPDDCPFVHSLRRALIDLTYIFPKLTASISLSFYKSTETEVTYTQTLQFSAYSDKDRTQLLQGNVPLQVTAICRGSSKSLVFDKSTIDFGLVASGSSSTQYLKITNNGTTNSTLTYSIPTPFSCTPATSLSINPGKYESLPLKYSPTDKGATTHTSYIKFVDSNSLTREVILYGKCSGSGVTNKFVSIYQYGLVSLGRTSWAERVGSAYDKSTHRYEDIEVTIDDYQQKFKVFIPPGTNSQTIYFEFDPEEKSNVIIFSAKIDTIPDPPPTDKKDAEEHCYHLADYFSSTKFVSDFEDDGRMLICHEGYNDELPISKCGWLYIDVYWKNTPAKSFKLIQSYSLNSNNSGWIWYTNLLMYHNITPVFDGYGEPLDDPKVYRAVSPYIYISRKDNREEGYNYGDLKVGILDSKYLALASIYNSDITIAGQSFTDFYYDTFTLVKNNENQYAVYICCNPKSSGKKTQYISFKDNDGRLAHLKVTVNAIGGSSTSDYELTPSSYDFGYSDKDVAVSYMFSFYNYTSKSVTAIASVPSGFYCSPSIFTVKGNSEQNLTVTFFPREVKAYSGDFLISDSDSSNTIARVTLNGTSSKSIGGPGTTLSTYDDLANEYASLYVNEQMAKQALEAKKEKLSQMETIINKVTPAKDDDAMDVFKTFNLGKLSGIFGTYGVTTAKDAVGAMISGKDNSGAINNNITFYKTAAEVYSQLNSGTPTSDIDPASPPGYDGDDETNPDKDDKESRYYLLRNVDYHMLYRKKKRSNGGEEWVTPSSSYCTIKVGDLIMTEDRVLNFVENHPEGITNQWYPVGLQEYWGLCPADSCDENSTNTNNTTKYKEYEVRHIKCNELEKVLCNDEEDPSQKGK